MARLALPPGYAPYGDPTDPSALLGAAVSGFPVTFVLAKYVPNYP